MPVGPAKRSAVAESDRAKRVTGMAPFVLRFSVAPCRSAASAQLRCHVPLSKYVGSSRERTVRADTGVDARTRDFLFGSPPDITPIPLSLAD
jgi:hypothetical protein